MTRTLSATLRLLAPAVSSAAVLALAAGALQAHALQARSQDQADGRWVPWTGCWESLGPEEENTLICIQPFEDGAELVTVIDDEIGSVETLIPDGAAREFEMEGCAGTRMSEFSADGERIYLTERAVCGGLDQETRGVIAMVAPDEWIDIRGMEGREGAFSRSYRLVSPERAAEAGFPDIQTGREMTVRMMRWRASEASSLDDLLEVDARVPDGVTRVWVAEQLDPFEIDADGLVRLADAGVPDDVIDVVVARSFPERFALRDGDPRERVGRRADLRGYGPGYPGYRPGYGAFGAGFGLWGSPYYHGAGYSPHGFYRERFIFPRRIRFIPGIGGRPTPGPGVRPLPGRGYVGRGGDRSGSDAIDGSSGGDRSTGRTARRRGGDEDGGARPPRP